MVAGDFNTSLARPHSYGVAAGRQILSGLLKEASLVCHTARCFTPPHCRNLIDHICTDLEPAEAVETWSGVDDKKPRLSDHPGVVVKLAV